MHMHVQSSVQYMISSRIYTYHSICKVLFKKLHRLL